MVPHKVAYKEEYYHNFYLFSIWDEEDDEPSLDDLEFPDDLEDLDGEEGEE